jgi:hypothetical protein
MCYIEMLQPKKACEHLENITNAEGDTKMSFEVRLLFARAHFLLAYQILEKKVTTK